MRHEEDGEGQNGCRVLLAQIALAGRFLVLVVSLIIVDCVVCMTTTNNIINVGGTVRVVKGQNNVGSVAGIFIPSFVLALIQRCRT